jgi:hypothetical protein
MLILSHNVNSFFPILDRKIGNNNNPKVLPAPGGNNFWANSKKDVDEQSVINSKVLGGAGTPTQEMDNALKEKLVSFATKLELEAHNFSLPAAEIVKKALVALEILADGGNQ